MDSKIINFCNFENVAKLWTFSEKLSGHGTPNLENILIKM